jgi:hypothetical protein
MLDMHVLWIIFVVIITLNILFELPEIFVYENEQIFFLIQTYPLSDLDFIFES